VRFARHFAFTNTTEWLLFLVVEAILPDIRKDGACASNDRERRVKINAKMLVVFQVRAERRDMEEFKSGSRPTTHIGYVNRRKQKCLGSRGRDGSNHFQTTYKLESLICGHFYGSNDMDVFLRKCPVRQGGTFGSNFNGSKRFYVGG
jgi:hypothetical protein